MDFGDSLLPDEAWLVLRWLTYIQQPSSINQLALEEY